MFEWLVDNSLLIYVVLFCLGAACVIAWWMNRSRAPLIGLGVILALTALLSLLVVLVQSDTQQLTAMIREMASAVPSKEPDRIVKHLSKKFNFQGHDKAAATEFVTEMIRHYDLQDVYVSQFEIEKLSRQSRQAGTATIRFMTRVDSAKGAELFHSEADCLLEDGKWRVQSFRIFRPGTTERIHIP